MPSAIMVTAKNACPQLAMASARVSVPPPFTRSTCCMLTLRGVSPRGLRTSGQSHDDVGLPVCPWTQRDANCNRLATNPLKPDESLGVCWSSASHLRHRLEAAHNVAMHRRGQCEVLTPELPRIGPDLGDGRARLRRQDF